MSRINRVKLETKEQTHTESRRRGEDMNVSEIEGIVIDCAI